MCGLGCITWFSVAYPDPGMSPVAYNIGPFLAKAEHLPDRNPISAAHCSDVKVNMPNVFLVPRVGGRGGGGVI